MMGRRHLPETPFGVSAIAKGEMNMARILNWKNKFEVQVRYDGGWVPLSVHTTYGKALVAAENTGLRIWRNGYLY
jgi:hypothetical protein